MIVVICVGRLYFLTSPVGMMYWYWVLWVYWPPCCKQKVNFTIIRLTSPLLLFLYTYWLFPSVELDESMLDALGILPQRKQHKKQLLVSKFHKKEIESSLIVIVVVKFIFYNFRNLFYCLWLVGTFIFVNYIVSFGVHMLEISKFESKILPWFCYSLAWLGTLHIP